MSIIKTINVKDFDREKFIKELKNNSFKVNINPGYILIKENDKYILSNSDNINNDSFEKKVDLLLSNSGKAMFLTFIFDYPEEYIYHDSNFELFSKDFFVPYDEDIEFNEECDDFYEMYKFRGCFELPSGKRFYGDDKTINFGNNNNNKSFGIVVEIENENIVLKKAVECNFDIYDACCSDAFQINVELITDAGQFEQDLIDFANKIS